MAACAVLKKEIAGPLGLCIGDVSPERYEQYGQKKSVEVHRHQSAVLTKTSDRELNMIYPADVYCWTVTPIAFA